jgi:hypothetical protein
VALKLIGVPLKEIPALRGARGDQLGPVLRAQRARLEEKRQTFGALVATLRDIERLIDRGQHTGPAVFRRIIEVMDMQTEDEWATVVRATSAHRRSLRPEVLAELGRRGAALLADAERLLDEEPTSPAVQALAARWTALIVEMNGPAVPMATLVRSGQATYRDAVTRKPELARSLWGRAVSLLGSAAELSLCPSYNPSCNPSCNPSIL